MIKPESQIIKKLAQAVQSYPELLQWMEDLFAHEMKRLPYAIENTGVFQGRCQMLYELIEFIKDAPSLAAKL